MWPGVQEQAWQRRNRQAEEQEQIWQIETTPAKFLCHWIDSLLALSRKERGALAHFASFVKKYLGLDPGLGYSKNSPPYQAAIQWHFVSKSLRYVFSRKIILPGNIWTGFARLAATKWPNQLASQLGR